MKARGVQGVTTITEEDIEDMGWTVDEIVENTDDYSDYHFPDEEDFKRYIDLVLTPSFHEIRELEHIFENPKCPDCLELDENVDATLNQEYSQRVSFREDENLEVHDLKYECERHGVFLRYLEYLSADEL